MFHFLKAGTGHFGNGRLRLSESNVYEHLKGILPDASDKQIVKLIG